jgi:hypothetical protein
MPQANEEQKPKQSKGRKVAASLHNAAWPSPGQAEEKHTMVRRSRADENTSNGTQVVITEDEFRALVAGKAYELFERRRAVTEVEDWLEAERLVKEQLLAQGRSAGSV